MTSKILFGFENVWGDFWSIFERFIMRMLATTHRCVDVICIFIIATSVEINFTINHNGKIRSTAPLINGSAMCFRCFKNVRESIFTFGLNTPALSIHETARAQFDNLTKIK